MGVLESLAVPALIVVCFGLTIWVIKSDLATIRKRMDCFETSQHACQLANAKEFATWEVVRGLDEKVDKIDGRVSRLEGKNGGGK